MNYLALNLTFMFIAFVILNVINRRSPWKVIGWSLLVMLLVTFIFDNVIIGLDVVAYDPAKISGILLGLAPIEDFAYTVVAVLAVASIWHKLTKEK